MPKNKGGKHFKKRRKDMDSKMIYKDTKNGGQLYGLVKKKYGNGRAQILCDDGTTRLGSLRGTLRRRCRLEENDIIIICPFEFQDNKGTIIHKYSDNHRLVLMNSGDCKFLNTFNSTNKIDNNICPFTFNNEEEPFNIDNL